MQLKPLLIFLSISSVLCQSSGKPQTTNSPDNNNNQRNSTSTDKGPSCQNGGASGRFVFQSPNNTLAIAFVGTPLFNVSWGYDQFTYQRPQEKITLSYTPAAKLGESNPWIVVASNISANATSYMWKIPPVTDGMYVLELFADNVQSMADVANAPCAGDGYKIKKIASYTQPLVKKIPDPISFYQIPYY